MAERIAIIGAGLMGSGIAQVSAVGGYDVTLRDVTDEALARGVAGIEKSLRKFAEKGAISDSDVDAALDRITTTTDLGRPQKPTLLWRRSSKMLTSRRNYSPS